MKTNNKLIKTCGILLIALVAGNVSAQTLVDVVLVNSQNPFYIQIFEASKADVKAVGINSSYGTSRQAKPDRLSLNAAVLFCDKIGMYIPTTQEWRLAATNLGQNIHYSHRSDTFIRSKTNIDSSDSVETTRISRIGIDAIGTVAMSGNRAEWVSEGHQCGGSYQSNSKSDIELSNICKTPGDFESPTATVRCVVRANGQIVQLSSKVKGELRQYLSSKGINGTSQEIDANAEPNAVNNTQAQIRPSEPAQITMDDLDIDDNESSFN